MVFSSAKSTKAKKQESEEPKGREISGQASNDAGQIIYGRARVGGVYSFLDTSSDVRAWLKVGSGDSNIYFTAVTPGSAGNVITVQIDASGTSEVITTSVSGNDIYIHVESNAGEPLSTAAEIISIVRSLPEVAALVTLRRDRNEGDGTGIAPTTEKTALAGGGGTWLHHYITLAAHRIDSIEKCYSDGKEVSFGASPDSRWATGDFAGHFFMATQTGAETWAQPDLVSQSPTKWTSYHKQEGCAGAYVITVWDSTLFSDGMPDLEFLVKGKPVYDPRTDSTAWTNNAALIIADYLIGVAGKYGLGFSISDFDLTNLADAATICEESVILQGGGTEWRYSINGVFDTAQTPSSVLEQMAAAIAGDIVYQNGKWFIYPGVWRTSSLTLTEDDLRGIIRVQSSGSLSESFNAVKGTFVSPDQKYEVTDFPAVKNATYAVQDQAVVWMDLSLNCVTSSSQCQRIAKIELERNRQSIEVNARFSLKALQLQMGDTCALTLARYGWTAKAFEVRSLALEMSPEGLEVVLTLKETASGVFTWANGEETTIDLAPNTNLPSSSSVAAPTDLAVTSGTADLYVRGDGTIFSRLNISWTAAADIYVQEGGYYEVEVKRTANSTWVPAGKPSSPITQIYFLDVQDGVSYDVRVRAVNCIAIPSSWVTLTGHVVIGKTAAPSDVASLTVSAEDYGLRFSWPPVSDLDLAEYEVRSGSSWEGGAVLTRSKTSTFHFYQKSAGSHSYLVKAVDTSGNFSQNAASATVTISAPVVNTVSTVTTSLDYGVIISATAGNYPIAQYEIRRGETTDTWDSASTLAIIKTTNFARVIDFLGTKTIFVKAYDNAGNTSAAVSANVTVTAPGAVTGLDAQISDSQVLLSWSAPSSGTLPIGEYEIRVGGVADTWATATFLVRTKATKYFTSVSGVGVFQYFVCAYDIKGNGSDVATEQLTIAGPNSPSGFYPDVVDNNVLLRWQAPSASSLPVAGYRLYKGETFAGATFLGEQKGTFAVYFEVVAASYTYWLTAIDSNGNESEEVYCIAEVDIPPDFIFNGSDTIDWDLNGAVETNIAFDGELAAIACIDTTTTYEDHFIDNSWATPQDQIDAGFPLFCEPGLSTAQYTTAGYDLGAVVGSSMITFVYDTTQCGAANATVTPTVEYSLDAETWTSGTAGQMSVWGTNFQYVRLNLDVLGADNAIAKMSNGQWIVKTKRKRMGYSDTVTNATNGKTIDITGEFVDIASVQPSPKYGGSARYAIADFTDVPNPTSLTVYLYDSGGTKTTGDFTVTIEGV